VEHIKSPLEMLRNGDGEQDASTDSVILRRIERRETDAMVGEIRAIIAGATSDAVYWDGEIDDERIRERCKRFGLAEPNFDRVQKARLKTTRNKQKRAKRSRRKSLTKTTSA
jgi:hypothetical protein